MEQDLFLRLAKHRSEPCLTLTMPTVVAGPETRQNAIRFKNLLATAAEKLTASGLDEKARERFLAPLQALEGDYQFWQHQDQGLAIFLGEGEDHRVLTPFELEEAAIVSDDFHIMPLLPLVMDNRDFYVLSLSKNQVELYECSRFSEKREEVPGLPGSVDEANRLDDPQATLQHHGNQRAASGNDKGIRHGQGEGKDNHSHQLENFAAALNRHLTPFLNQRQLPLVTLAHGELLACFERHCKYAQNSKGVEVAPEALSPAEMRAQGWKVIGQEMAAHREGAISEALRKISHNQATVDKEEALVAAKEGRAESALVASDRHVWSGHQLNGAGGNPHFQTVDLLNEIARHTLMHGGKVYDVPSERLPQNEPLVVTLRY